ncbi:cytochrome P450 [Wolfiporia cocos MD-104 SS10]|uniref:Cytochrome P450 n=1 Tax=Wolfiporia cocos (strain MD-104) TaxID=742152 RepID=A0A2H3IXK4_WOLCO|nr:cytochrome P450 [Wolfiporia cocos MD-104 SS10]
MNEELRKIPDSHVSFVEAAEAFISTRHTIAPDVNTHPIHLPVIRGPLTRNLGVVFSDVIDEIFAAFPDVIKLDGDEWTSVALLPTMAKVVSRASNRVFVGLPLCRDTGYLNTVVCFSSDVVKGRVVLGFVPRIFKGLIGRMLPWSRRAIRRTTDYVFSIIEDRQVKLRKLGDDWSDKPNDLLMWLIEEADKSKLSIDIIVQGLLLSNFAAIHTSSNSITHALYHLAAHPEYMQPLREEIEAVLKEHRWTKISIGKMRKLDSFMRESQRLSGITALSVMRKILQDITLSNGTFLPKGTVIASAASATHHDERYYKHADEFEGFRFANMRTEESERIKHQYVSTSSEYIAFGHGRHACPGRFFAVNELKVMMAYMILNYDVKFEGNGGRPEDVWVWHAVRPNPSARVMLRKRQCEAV